MNGWITQRRGTYFVVIDHGADRFEMTPRREFGDDASPLRVDLDLGRDDVRQNAPAVLDHRGGADVLPGQHLDRLEHRRVHLLLDRGQVDRGVAGIGQRLVDVGCQAVMPWAAPIGTGKGPINPYAMQVLRERLAVPLIVDAGLGKPSHACQVMEWGYDGVLLNTAVALAQDPVAMAGAFADAVQAGRSAHHAGAMGEQQSAQPSTPVLGTPFWHHS